MKIKEVMHIRGGEILVSPVYSKEGQVLLPAGTILKTEYAELLLSMSVHIVEIEDIYQKDECPHLLIEDEPKSGYLAQIEKILENHIYSDKETLRHMKNLAEEIESYTQQLELNRIYDYENRSANLYEHTLMVTILSLMIARKLEFSKEERVAIALGCLLHDLGLRYVTTDYIDMKQEEMSPADMFEYKKHTIFAYTVLDGEDDWLPMISKKMVLSHHEKIDGSGFPLKQKKQETECRIIQLCDTFDCMICGIECERNSIHTVLNKIYQEINEKYDKDVYNHFSSLIAKYPVGTRVLTSEDREAIVIEQGNDSYFPIISYSLADGKISDKDICNLEKSSGIYIEKVIE